MTPLTTILVPTDFSPHAAAALAFAVDLAKRTQAALHIVHVDDFVSYTLPVPGLVVEGSLLAELRENLRKRVFALRAEAQKAGVSQVEATVLEGKPHPEIIRQAEKLPADLIVMGTHGRSGFSHLMLGSITERVTRSARCPVIAVPLKPEVTAAAE